MYSGFTLRMISTKYPLGFINILLLFGISFCRYSPETSNLAMLRPSCASSISLHNSAYKYTMANKKLSLSLRYLFWLLPSVQVLTFILPHIFSFIRFTASDAFLLSSNYNVYVLIGLATGFPDMFPLSISLCRRYDQFVYWDILHVFSWAESQKDVNSIYFYIELTPYWLSDGLLIW